MNKVSAESGHNSQNETISQHRDKAQSDDAIDWGQVRICHAKQPFRSEAQVLPYNAVFINSAANGRSSVLGRCLRTHLPEASARPQFTLTSTSNLLGRPPITRTCPSRFHRQGNEKKITGSIPCKLTDFKIDPPTLLTMPIKTTSQ